MVRVGRFRVEDLGFMDLSSPLSAKIALVFSGFPQFQLGLESSESLGDAHSLAPGESSSSEMRVFSTRRSAWVVGQPCTPHGM